MIVSWCEVWVWSIWFGCKLIAYAPCRLFVWTITLDALPIRFASPSWLPVCMWRWWACVVTTPTHTTRSVYSATTTLTEATHKSEGKNARDEQVVTFFSRRLDHWCNGQASRLHATSLLRHLCFCVCVIVCACCPCVCVTVNINKLLPSTKFF